MNNPQKPKWKWLLLPLTPIVIPIAFVIGFVLGLIETFSKGKNARIATRYSIQASLYGYREVHQRGQGTVFNTGRRFRINPKNS